jgi:hypothetical protein
VAKRRPRRESAGRLRDLVAERDALRFSATGFCDWPADSLNKQVREPGAEHRAVRPPLPQHRHPHLVSAPRESVTTGEIISWLEGTGISRRNNLGEASVLRAYRAKVLVTSLRSWTRKQPLIRLALGAIHLLPQGEKRVPTTMPVCRPSPLEGEGARRANEGLVTLAGWPGLRPAMTVEGAGRPLHREREGPLPDRPRPAAAVERRSPSSRSLAMAPCPACRGFRGSGIRF